MSFALSAGLDTSQRFIGVVPPTALAKYAGIALHFATFGALLGAVVAERLNVADGLPMWSNGQPMTTAVEARSATRFWNSYNARTVLIGAKQFVLGSDTAMILATVGQPVNSVGADDDSAYDSATRTVYTKLLGQWDAGVPLATKTNGPLRVVAMDNNWSMSSAFTSTAAKGGWIKGEAEAAFNQVRVCWRTVSDTPPPLDCMRWAVAVSEDGRNDTAARAWTPIIGGVSRNVLVSTSDPNSWRVGDFTGGTITQDTTGGNGNAANPQWVLRSAPITLASIPRTDVVGGRPIWLARWWKGSSFPVAVRSPSPQSPGQEHAPTTGDVYAGEPWTRMRRMNQGAVNGVDTLAYFPSGVASSYDDCCDVFLEFTYSAPVRYIAVGGDSINENFGAYGWASKGILSLSTPSAPCVPLLLGRSGTASSTFGPALKDIINSGGPVPTDLIYPCYTPNDGGSATYWLSVLDKLIDRHSAEGTRAIVWDSAPTGNGRPQAQQWAIAQAKAGRITYLEMGKLIASTSDPNDFAAGMTYGSGHPSQAAVNVMYPAFRDHLASIATL